MQHPLPGLQHSGSVYTTSNGAPVKNPSAFQRVGQNGPLLLQDFHLIDLLAHFDRERIPERVVHAKGAGAYGEFVVTHDVSDLTSASMLNAVGKKTRALVRFSTVGGEKGSPDSARDPRGFAIKFYTEEGNWDWVFNNTPVFFLRDPANFPTFIHTQKRNPQSNLKDADAFWDYLSTHQECTHQVMHLFSDRGTPYSYRHMNGYSGHTFKWTKPDGSFVYVKIHLKTKQGNKTFTGTEASKMEAENPDWQTQDLFKAIQKGDFPSWDVYVQVLTPEQAEGFKWNIFDLTKVWPQKDVPLRPFGRLTLNQNADNYFAEIEQAAFSPSHLVPGVEPSADPVLQSRLFSYPDTHRHRLGVNYQQIPVNQPLRAFNPFQRDGAMAVNGNHGALPNYPSSSRPLIYSSVSEQSRAHERWTGQVVSDVFSEVKPKDFEQANGLWRVLAKTTGQQANFVQNVAGHLCNAQKSIRERTYGMFSRVNSDLGRLIQVETEKRTK
ncbi:catalase-like domain-containing protein [Truncatella angustata]|uniref:Catalase n=1 Tax=Truncatella angustata TaxID=152316 RepID=A0A9P8ZVS9_9PEZI|nr:catalase-like domain-containing protein [Truncatella angustata]KAH6649178.1 catalase-like domain-containing protein [Truncatella angustata]